MQGDNVNMLGSVNGYMAYLQAGSKFVSGDGNESVQKLRGGSSDRIGNEIRGGKHADNLSQAVFSSDSRQADIVISSSASDNSSDYYNSSKSRGGIIDIIV